MVNYRDVCPKSLVLDYKSFEEAEKEVVEGYQKGRDFEKQVADLYRLMGYIVEHNVGLLGHQIDIILTFTMPG